MFQMFGFGGVKCPRCEHKSGNDAGYCEQCGMTLGAPRNPVVLRDNRWLPAADEFAVFFGVRALSGLFVKTLHVPPSARAYILQGSKATEVPQGEYEIEGFFTRLNHLLRDQHGEILITRSLPMAVEFSFDDLFSAEHLALSVRFSVALRIEQVAAFAHHFMTMPGTVTAVHLRELLSPSVRQLAAEFVGAQSLRDMAANGALRAELDERLHSSLKLRLAQYGLAVSAVDTLELHHDKYDANRARVGSLWLVADQGHVQLEHTKQLDQLYNDEQWQRICREEQESRVRHRRAELRQDEQVERAELNLQEAERVQAIRARQVDLYARIVEANSRKQAIERGAGATLAELEHELAKKGAALADDAAEWEHLRQLAQIRMRTEVEIAQQDALEARQLAQQRFSHQLLQQQIANQIAQALGIEDQARQRDELRRLRQNQITANQRAAAIEAEEHSAAWQSLALANLAHKREAERMLEWEEQLALDRQRDLLRADAAKAGAASIDAEEVAQKIDAMRRNGAQADAIAQYEKLLRTIDADGQAMRQAQSQHKQALLDQFEVDQQRHMLKQQEQEAAWQHELRRLEHEREEKFARWRSEYDALMAQQAHAADLARIDIARAEAIGAMSDTGKVALAAAPNAAVLAELLKTQVHAGMSAPQLAALAGVVGAANSVAPLEAMRMAREQVQDERARRDADSEHERRHLLELLALQNSHNQSALAQQSQLGIGVAQAVRAQEPSTPRCPQGHAVRSGDKFCAECGIALQA